MRTTPGPRQSRECQQARRVHAQGPEAGERTLVTSLIEPESSIALYPTVIVPYAPRRAAPRRQRWATAFCRERGCRGAASALRRPIVRRDDAANEPTLAHREPSLG